MAYSLPKSVGTLCLADRASSLRTATKARTLTTRRMASGQSRFHEDLESANVFPYDNRNDFHNGGFLCHKDGHQNSSFRHHSHTSSLVSGSKRG